MFDPITPVGTRNQAARSASESSKPLPQTTAFRLANLLTQHWVAFLMAFVFCVVFFWLNSRAYLAFQVRAPDLDRFSQAIWLTLRGEFLYTTIKEGSILQHHFTPYMALLSPLLWLWEDVRILYLAQIVGFAIGCLLLYAIAQKKRKIAATILLAALLLNHNLHQLMLFELRRVTLAFPYLALIAYALYVKDRRLLVIGTIFALLCKEEIGLIISGVGLFLLVKERNWRWGLLYLFGGAAWLLVMLEWVIPAFGEGYYPQLGYFSDWGESLSDVIVSMLLDPLRVLQTMFDEVSLRALWRLLLPVALVVPLLGFEYVLICLPLLGVLLLGTEPEMHALQRWYLASIIPFLFAAVMVTLTRLPRRRAVAVSVVILLLTLWTYRQYSPAPFGKLYTPYRYEVTERQLSGWQLLDMIPEDAAVSAQTAFSVQLSQREQIYVYPEEPELGADYIVVADRYNGYPYEAYQLPGVITDLLAEPSYTLVAEADEMYLLEVGGEPAPVFDIGRIFESTIELEKAEIAVADPSALYTYQQAGSIAIKPGQTLRIALYWRALDAPNAERTVSVRIVDPAGGLIAQHDSQPANASRPTSWWQPGWYFREYRYLTIPETTPPGEATLEIVLYDSYTIEAVKPDGGGDNVTIAPVEIGP